MRNLDVVTRPLDPKMGVPLHFVCSRDGETKTRNKSKYRYIQEVFVLNHGKLMDTMLQVKVYNKKKDEGNRHNKWGENPSAIAPDTKTEGDDSNLNNEPSISQTILPEGDFSKVVVDEIMADAVLTKLECNMNSKKTAKIVAVFHNIFHLED